MLMRLSAITPSPVHGIAGEVPVTIQDQPLGVVLVYLLFKLKPRKQLQNLIENAAYSIHGENSGD
jgi:hypothetical protein